MPVNEKRLVKMLTEELENCENFLAEKAYAKNSEYVKVLEATLEELGLMVNETGLTLELVKARLRGEEISVPEWHVKALWDVTFDFNEYRLLGDNDGELRMIMRVARMLRRNKLAARAAAAMYSD
jgi:hypothetical protein